MAAMNCGVRPTFVRQTGYRTRHSIVVTPCWNTPANRACFWHCAPGLASRNQQSTLVTPPELLAWWPGFSLLELLSVLTLNSIVSPVALRCSRGALVEPHLQRADHGMRAQQQGT